MTAISPRAVVVTPFFPSSSSFSSSSSSSSSVRVARSDGRRCGAGTSPVVRGALVARPRQSLVHRRQDDGSRGNLTLMRAEPTTTTNTLNEVLLQGGPLFLPLLLSTSAALYRGASKAAAAAAAAKESGEGGGEGGAAGGFRALRGTLSALPKGMWVGIGAVWCYWVASTQLGIF